MRIATTYCTNDRLLRRRYAPLSGFARKMPQSSSDPLPSKTPQISSKSKPVALHGLSTASLASGLRGAGGDAVDNPASNQISGHPTLSGVAARFEHGTKSTERRIQASRRRRGEPTLKSTNPFVFPIVLTLFGFALWRAQFACPRCGTPYLYGIKGGFFVFPSGLGNKCGKCGWPTDQVFAKDTAVSAHSDETRAP